MTNLVQLCARRFANAEIVVGRVFPRVYNNPATSDIYSRRAREFNNLITNYMGTNNVIFHNFISATAPYFYDGIHVTNTGAAAWVRNIKSVLNYKLGLVPYSEYGHRRGL